MVSVSPPHVRALVVGLTLAASGSASGCEVPRFTDARSEAYAEILVRELRADRATLTALRDTLSAQKAGALLWVDWIDEKASTGSRNLLSVMRSLSERPGLELRRRIYGEIERSAEWARLPDPSFREDLVRYHELAARFESMGRREVGMVREHVAAVMGRDTWMWLYSVPSEEGVFPRFKEAVPLFWNEEYRTVMRVVALSVADRVALVDEMLALNATLEQCARAWLEEVR